MGFNLGPNGEIESFEENHGYAVRFVLTGAKLSHILAWFADLDDAIAWVDREVESDDNQAGRYRVVNVLENGSIDYERHTSDRRTPDEIDGHPNAHGDPTPSPEQIEAMRREASPDQFAGIMWWNSLSRSDRAARLAMLPPERCTAAECWRIHQLSRHMARSLYTWTGDVPPIAHVIDLTRDVVSIPVHVPWTGQEGICRCGCDSTHHSGGGSCDRCQRCDAWTRPV